MTKGFADIHNHQFANFAFGGLAFWGGAYGDIHQELPWCTPAHGPGGAGDLVGTILYGWHFQLDDPLKGIGHLVGGDPQFDGWPRWNSFTHQAMFEDWLARAVEGGLRLMVVHAVNNEWMCGQVATAPGRTCNDMEAVGLQLQAAKDMENYIDRKNGGPGQGWYRIAHSPDEARATIDEGKLAVVLGIEVDYLFNAHSPDDLSATRLRELLNGYFALGVRHIFPVHFSNNAFGGTAFQNPLIYDMYGPPAPSPQNPKAIAVLPYAVETEAAPEYEYRTGRRNVQGLTDLGGVLIKELMRRGIMIDVDHTSFHTRADILDLAEANDYPVVSGHTGFVEISHADKSHEGQLLPEEVERIRKLGGIVAPIINQGKLAEIESWQDSTGTSVPHTCGNTTETWVQAYLYLASKMGGAPIAFGTDFNGLINPVGPRFGKEACPGGQQGSSRAGDRIESEFVAAASGVRLPQSVVGEKTFDFNEDGLAHIGLLPDFIADLEQLGLTAKDLDPLLNSAEGYVDAWDRAWSKRYIEPARCQDIATNVQQLRQEIERLTETRKGLNPRDPQDKIEIKEIDNELKDTRQQVQALEDEAQSLGCMTV
jgi:microsomal dipeptidase-like Zn-dependent dipeptidase